MGGGKGQKRKNQGASAEGWGAARQGWRLPHNSRLVLAAASILRQDQGQDWCTLNDKLASVGGRGLACPRRLFGSCLEQTLDQIEAFWTWTAHLSHAPLSPASFSQAVTLPHSRFTSEVLLGSPQRPPRHLL